MILKPQNFWDQDWWNPAGVRTKNSALYNPITNQNSIIESEISQELRLLTEELQSV